MRYVLIFTFMLLSFPVFAAEWTWNKGDTVREVIGLGLTVVDWGQTNDIASRKNWIELNPILSQRPTRKEVREYFTYVMILHPLVSLALPAEVKIFGFKTKPRMAWQYIYIGVEGTATSSNVCGGLRVTF